MKAMLRFAVIGHPVGHSLSPAMHAANFRALGLAAAYGAEDVAPEDLPAALRRFAARGYRGINCTIPHKEAVLPLMTRLDVSALRCGAVNTVRFEADGSTTGFNTDKDGFAAALAENGLPVVAGALALDGMPVAILGAGGAARAVAVACLEARCASLTLVNRTPKKARMLREAVQALEIPGCPPVTVREEGFDRIEEVSFEGLLVNCTSVGLKADDPAVLPAACFHAGQTVCDIIPVRRETRTLAQARAQGARTIGGLGMLVHQGAAAFRIWMGRSAVLPAMAAALREHDV